MLALAQQPTCFLAVTGMVSAATLADDAEYAEVRGNGLLLLHAGSVATAYLNNAYEGSMVIVGNRRSFLGLH